MVMNGNQTCGGNYFVVCTDVELLCCIPNTWRRKVQPTPVLLPGKSHGQRSLRSVQFSRLVVSDSLRPMNRSTPGAPVHHQLPEFTQTHVHRVCDAIQPSYPWSSLLLLPPIPPSIRVFSDESTLHMRWPKYQSFSFSIILPKKSRG